MSFQDHMNQYPQYHQHPWNQRLHSVGIPLIILGILLPLASPWGLWPLLLIPTGAALLILGHRIEGNRPALTTNPIYLLVGPVWLVKKTTLTFKRWLGLSLMILLVASPCLADKTQHKKGFPKLPPKKDPSLTAPANKSAGSELSSSPGGRHPVKTDAGNNPDSATSKKLKNACESKVPVETFVQISSSHHPQAITPHGIYFMSDFREITQVYRMQSPGQWPEQISFFPDGVPYYDANQDGRLLLLATHQGGDEQYNIYLYDAKTKKTEPLLVDKSVRVDSVKWAPDSTWFAYTSNARNKTDMDLYRMDLATKKVTLLAELSGQNSVTDISPDGKKISVTEYRSIADSDLWVYNDGDKKISCLTKHQGDTSHFDGQFSADSQTIFFLSDMSTGVTQLYSMNLNSGVRKVLTSGKWEVETFVLDGSRKTLAFTTNEEGYSTLNGWMLSRQGTKGRVLPLPALKNQVLSSMTFGPAVLRTPALFYSLTSSTQTSDIWQWQLGRATQWTQSSKGTLAAECLTREELIHYPSFDGKQIPAFLFRPAGASGPIPFIVYVHGGPESQYRPVFSRIFQYFLQRGFGILAPNIRGSSGYGRAYTQLDNYKKRMDSVIDVVEGAKWLIRQRQTSAGQLAIYGGSYGGFLVLRSIEVEPELFAAASESVGISNFVTFLKNTKSYRRALREVEYGPLTDEEFLKSVSPITHVDRIKTPLLIFHGANDPRVPVSEAEQIAEALKKRGIVVETKIFSDEGHGNAKLRNQMEQARTMAHFFETHLKEK